MTYLLKKITLKDQEKIIEDASTNSREQQRLAFAMKRQEFTDSWAIDRDRNYYLLLMPCAMREEQWDTPYLVFVKGEMYRINRKGQAGHQFYFDEEVLPATPLLAELQEEIRTAFAVYGCWGEGPLNASHYTQVSHRRTAEHSEPLGQRPPLLAAPAR